MKERRDGAARNPPPPLLIGGLWSLVVLLSAIGAGAVIGRGVFPTDLGTRMEPLRDRIMGALDRDDPLKAPRPEELKRFDGRFGEHPLATLLHILPGGLFLVLAPLQFSSRIRNRHIAIHRWSGRVLVLAGFVSAVAGLYFGLLMPYAGPPEAAALTPAGFGPQALFVLSVWTGWAMTVGAAELWIGSTAPVGR
jgi:hypothetical protein